MKKRKIIVMLVCMLFVFSFTTIPVLAKEIDEESFVTESLVVEENEIDSESVEYEGKETDASYPLMILDTTESTTTIPQGETGKLVFNIFREYNNEKYYIEVYNSSGVKVASASGPVSSTSSLVSLTIDVSTANTNNWKVGNYTVKYWMDYYTFFEWHTVPTTRTATLKIVENVCNGNHNYKQNSVYKEATCEDDGLAYMVCTKCGNSVYETIPSTNNHDWNEGVITTPPTDYASGVRTYTCEICDTTKTESIPALKTAPAKPYKIANVVSGVHVYWNAVEGAQKYGLWRSETGKEGTYKWVANPTVPHFTDIKVTSGKTYYYKVTVFHVDYDVHSDKSEAIGVTYVSTPDITSRINKAAGIQLGWNKINGATGYAIYRMPYGGTTWTRIATINNPSTLTWTDEAVKANNGTVYKYTIRALAGSNNNTLSGCRATGRTMVRLASRTLTGAVKTSATSVKCNWTTSSAVSGYEVRFMVGSNVYETYTIGNYKTGTKTFTGLTAGQTYKIQVRSYKKVDGVGSFYSAWSTAKTVTL